VICGCSRLDATFTKCVRCGGSPTTRKEQCHISEDTKAKLLANADRLNTFGVTLEQYKPLQKSGEILATVALVLQIAESLKPGVLRELVLFLKELAIPDDEILRLRLDEPERVLTYCVTNEKLLGDESYSTQLASGFTVHDYSIAVAKHDSERIAAAIHRRFTERYIAPLKTSKQKHGFTIMAISCLMIEALESFRCGWKNSKGKSKAAFRSFFHREDEFMDLRRFSPDFYEHVRSVVLNQAETTGGWKITIKKATPLFDPDTLTLNAEQFLNRLCHALDQFTCELKTAKWDSRQWRNVRTKMQSLCDNSYPKRASNSSEAGCSSQSKQQKVPV
jgi:hypothetical protein